jgi:hypothetical protein
VKSSTVGICFRGAQVWTVFLIARIQVAKIATISLLKKSSLFVDLIKTTTLGLYTPKLAQDDAELKFRKKIYF